MPSLPPSDRDLEIYESVHIAGYSLRAAAAKHGLSVTRIRQIAQRVIEFLAQTLPAETDLDKQQQIQIARHIAADRLHYAQCELMDLWRQTQDPSYLLKTTRLTLAAARLGVVAGTIEGAIAEAWESAGLLDEDGEVTNSSLPSFIPPPSPPPPPSRTARLALKTPLPSQHLHRLPFRQLPPPSLLPPDPPVPTSCLDKQFLNPARK